MKAVVVKFVALVIFLSAGLISLSAGAQPLAGHGNGMGRGQGHDGSGHGPGWALKQLDLNPQQQEALACEIPGQGRELKEAITAERIKLNNMIRVKETPDDQIYVQLDKVNQKFSEWNKFRLEKMLKARSVLTESQMTKLLELQDEAGNKQAGTDAAQ